MTEDLYNTWLGVAAGLRPPDHYRLLGLSLWCDDPAVIERSARAQLAKLDRYAIHQDPAKRGACNRLMNEVAKARVVLVSPQRRAAYNRELSLRLRIPAPAPPARDVEVLSADTSEQDADVDAEAYLNAIASAATTAGAKRRPRPATSRNTALPAILTAVGVVIVAALSVWIFWRPGRQQARATPNPAVAPVDQPVTPAPQVVAKPVPALTPPPPVVGKLFGLPVGQPAQEQPPATPSPGDDHSSLPSPTPTSPPQTAPTSPPPDDSTNPTALDATNGPVAWTRQLNALDNWTIVRGDWSTTPDGHILGKGDSQIDFKYALPQNVAISFRMRVLDGIRPRVKFGSTGIYVGNEGYTKNIMVHGQTHDLSGKPVPYEQNQEMAVRVVFLPDDRFIIRVDDHVMTGRHDHSKSGKISVHLLGGDSWSHGSTEFWDFKVGSVDVVDTASGKVLSASAPGPETTTAAR